MNTAIKRLAALTLAFSPLTLFAHGGHGVFHGHELAHYLLSPIHLIPSLIILSVIVLFGYNRYLKRKAQKQRS